MISIIVAISKNHVIGNNGAIPWKIKGEQRRFKALTTGNTIIMGRKSFEEIGHPLPDRRTIVISSTKKFPYGNCVTVNSLSEAFDLTKDEKEVFIAGGGQVYREALPYTDKLYITVIDRSVEGNIYFSEICKENFIKTFEKRIEEAEIPYTYYTYERKK